MEQTQPGFAAEKRVDNDNRKQSTSVPAARVEQQQPKQESLMDHASRRVLIILIIGFTLIGLVAPWARL